MLAQHPALHRQADGAPFICVSQDNMTALLYTVRMCDVQLSESFKYIGPYIRLIAQLCCCRKGASRSAERPRHPHQRLKWRGTGGSRCWSRMTPACCSGCRRVRVLGLCDARRRTRAPAGERIVKVSRHAPAVSRETRCLHLCGKLKPCTNYRPPLALEAPYTTRELFRRHE